MKSLHYSLALSSVITLLVPQIAFAQWIPIVRGSSSQTYVNEETIEISNRYVKFWERRVWDIPKRNRVAVTDSQTIIDCDTGHWRALQLIEYNSDGGIVYESQRESKVQGQTFANKPGTVGNAVYNFVCQ